MSGCIPGSRKAIVRDGRIAGVICETKAGREAIMGDVVIDASGDLDVAAAAGAAFTEGAYIVTTVFRLGGVDTDDGRAISASTSRRSSPAIDRRRSA